MDFFFTLSKIIPALLYPLPLVLIFLFYWGFKKNKGRKKLFVLLPVGLLWAFSTPLVVNATLGLWELPLGDAKSLIETYDVAVVLGGLSQPEYSTSQYVEFNGAVERLLVPLELYKADKVKKILISSGSGSLLNQKDKESDALGDFALRWGVKSEDLLLERESRNTFENALFSGKILDKNNLHHILLFTSAFHMRRSLAIFKKQGLIVTPYPVDTLKDATPFPLNCLPYPESLGDFQTLLKEIAGYIVYSFLGYL